MQVCFCLFLSIAALLSYAWNIVAVKLTTEKAEKIDEMAILTYWYLLANGRFWGVVTFNLILGKQTPLLCYDNLLIWSTGSLGIPWNILSSALIKDNGWSGVHWKQKWSWDFKFFSKEKYKTNTAPSPKLWYLQSLKRSPCAVRWISLRRCQQVCLVCLLRLVSFSGGFSASDDHP